MDLALIHQHFLSCDSVSTDTRKITPNCMFFALKGPNFNGNAFAEQALVQGASFALIDEENYKISEKTILVDNVLETLQKLSIYHRNYCKTKIVSLTGSNGKTTTKELIHAVLSTTYKTIATIGNLNNHIGVPLTLLRLTPDTEIGIVEMGANHQGEIAFLSNLAQPDFGYITNFGKAHLEGFGGIEGVIKGKSELYSYLKKHDKHIFLNADDPIQLEKLAPYIKKIGFSQELQDYYQIQLLSANPKVRLQFEDITVQTQLIGAYNFTNCCAAITIAKYFNVPKKAIKKALENYNPKNNRSQLLEKNGHHVILDAYNANPTSTKAALTSFAALPDQSKIVFLGDMFEVGATAHQEHQAIADYLLELGLNNAYLVGENYNKVKTMALQFKNFEALKKHLNAQVIPKSTLLIKGSRGMAMERILDLL
ncbi:UDP-N-acetylmuramoyl-tripeptide--D-alanyl-D-alanine ligase [Flavobacterium sp. ASW18X]|uniref:UDP-N-acetylmuramoyl-tripeptide--D-alanyl-D- alanine ligase n=1 Tax=Flavobacterium sp. ASW18X TaxID=2572595 RepID=UPI0010AE797A|nr:UDP-N-acetylmuramoyl-tripeptide--D-alanyl-D-alanine ligase [Flavobacterium sp. ASW18X]TKD59333.1 UDP-N-acetylmuramoyl-tripeptide--D-alanyl-D-alanine ligase [Flavobacterium sp. ASW18X]